MVKYKSSTNQLGVEVIGSIFSTSDYTIFKKLKGNRKVKKNKNLRKELEDMGQTSPIVVNSNFEVIDGQHRLDILKSMGKPVSFIISNAIAPRMVISMNTAQVNWKDIDYLEFYVAQGNAPYIRLQQIYNQYQKYVSLTVLIDLITTGDKEKFRNGLIDLKDEISILSRLSFLKEFVLETGYNNPPQTVQISLLRFSNIPYANRSRFIKKFKQLGMVNEKHLFVNREKCFEAFVVQINNHKIKPGSRGYIYYHYNSKKNIVIDPQM